MPVLIFIYSLNLWRFNLAENFLFIQIQVKVCRKQKKTVSPFAGTATVPDMYRSVSVMEGRIKFSGQVTDRQLL